MQKQQKTNEITLLYDCFASLLPLGTLDILPFHIHIHLLPLEVLLFAPVAIRLDTPL